MNSLFTFVLKMFSSPKGSLKIVYYIQLMYIFLWWKKLFEVMARILFWCKILKLILIIQFFYVQEFGLIDKKELAPLQELIESIVVPYWISEWDPLKENINYSIQRNNNKWLLIYGLGNPPRMFCIYDSCMITGTLPCWWHYHLCKYLYDDCWNILSYAFWHCWSANNSGFRCQCKCWPCLMVWSYHTSKQIDLQY